MERITIIGLGLIGGSLGLALKEADLEGVEIIGYDKDARAASGALKRGAVDRVGPDLPSVVERAGIVVIATPVGAVEGVLKGIAPHITRGSVVTDTGSTKAQVLAWAKEHLPPGVGFVGGHPMAGKEKSGVEEADAGLFRGCTYCIVPSPKAPPEAVRSVVSMAELVGARPLFLEAAEHDNLVAAISHLPLLLSTALVSATTGDSQWKRMSRLASSGYRDVSRLASGNPEMSRDICLTNREALVRWIDHFMKELTRYRSLVLAGDAKLEGAFVQVREAREEWLRARKTFTDESSAKAGPPGVFIGGRLAMPKKLAKAKKG